MTNGKDGESKQAEDSFLKSLVQTNVTASSKLTGQESRYRQLDPHKEGGATRVGALPSVHYILVRRKKIGLHQLLRPNLTRGRNFLHNQKMNLHIFGETSSQKLPP